MLIETPNIYNYPYKDCNLYSYYVDNIFIGSFLLEEFNNYYIIWKFKINDPYKNQKYGSKMLEELISTFKKDIYLYVIYDNEIAIKLYKKFNFIENDDKIENIIIPNKNLNLIKFKLKI